MIRIICTSDFKAALEARGFNPDKIKRVMKHGQMETYTKLGVKYFDILLDADSEDLPRAVINALRNEASVIYVAEWELNSNPDEPVDPTKPAGRKKAHVWKGVDPGCNRFMGWPI